MFFARRSEAPTLEPSWFRGLRFSLNTPVVRTDGLPVAPARAALVLYELPEGPPGVLVGVRSLKSGQVVHFEPEGTVDAIEEGLDAAMAFGEGMGFLFDDDELEEGEPERAFGMWHDLMGELDSAASEAPAPDPADDELLLTEAVPEGGRPEPTSNPGSSGPQAPPDTDALTSLVESALAGAEGAALPPLGETPQPMLTKFRTGDEFEDYALTNPGLPAAQPLVVEDYTAETEDDADGSRVDPGPPLPDDGTRLPPSAMASAAATEMATEPDAETTPDTDEPDAETAPDNDDAPAEREPRRRGRGRAALGKLRLVKKRLSSSDASKRQFLARILSEF